MFNFRTRSPNGLLFCHLVEQFNQSVHPLLRNYHFCAELSHGHLQVKYNLNQKSDVLELGRGKLRAERERERELKIKDILVPWNKILHTRNVLSISLHDESLDIYKSDSEI